jgi:hypothetical protein
MTLNAYKNEYKCTKTALLLVYFTFYIILCLIHAHNVIKKILHVGRNNIFYYFILLSSKSQSIMTRDAYKNEYKYIEKTSILVYLSFISLFPSFFIIFVHNIRKTYKVGLDNVFYWIILLCLQNQ